MPNENPFHIPIVARTSTMNTTSDKRTAPKGVPSGESSVSLMGNSDHIPGTERWDNKGRRRFMHKEFITFYVIIGLLTTGKYLNSTVQLCGGNLLGFPVVNKALQKDRRLPEKERPRSRVHSIWSTNWSRVNGANPTISFYCWTIKATQLCLAHNGL